MRNFGQVGVLVGVAVLIASCNKDLGRDDAANILSPQINGKRTLVELPLDFQGGNPGCGFTSQEGAAAAAERIQNNDTWVRNGIANRIVLKKLIPTQIFAAPYGGFDCIYGRVMATSYGVAVYTRQLSPESRSQLVSTKDTVQEFTTVSYGEVVGLGRGQTTKSQESFETAVLVRNSLRFVDVTGISGNDTVKQVFYTFVVEPTSIGKALGDTPQTRSASAVFQKFDDGWRLVGSASP